MVFSHTHVATSTLEVLQLANTKINNPILPRAIFPNLNEVVLDSVELRPDAVFRLLIQGDGLDACPSKVLLRGCRTIDDHLIHLVGELGGLRPTLIHLDLSGSSTSVKALMELIKKSKHRHANLTILPDLPPNVDEGDTSNQHNEQEDDDDDDSSIGSQTMRIFIRNMDRFDDSSVNVLDEQIPISNPNPDQADEDSRRSAYQQHLTTLCCNCEACALAHLGRIFVPKQRYSKAELLALRPC